MRQRLRVYASESFLRPVTSGQVAAALVTRRFPWHLLARKASTDATRVYRGVCRGVPCPIGRR